MVWYGFAVRAEGVAGGLPAGQEVGNLFCVVKLIMSVGVTVGSAMRIRVGSSCAMDFVKRSELKKGTPFLRSVACLDRILPMHGILKNACLRPVERLRLRH